MVDIVIGTIIFSGVLGLVGIILSIIGMSTLISRKKKKRNCTSKIYGKVTNIVRKEYYSIHSHKYIYSWHPVYEYNIGELKFIKTSVYGNSQPTYEKVGQNVELYFNPKDFNEYYVKEETRIEILGKTFAISGIVIMTIAILSTIVIVHLV